MYFLKEKNLLLPICVLFLLFVLSSAINKDNFFIHMKSILIF